MASPSKSAREISVKWDDVLLVCRKCGKKLDGGFGPDGDAKLEKVLRKTLKGEGKRRVKIVPVSCLDICPKGAVTVVKGSNPGHAYLIPSGTDATEAVKALGLD